MSVDVNVGLVYDGAVIEINHQTGQYTVVSDDAPDDRLIKITKLNGNVMFIRANEMTASDFTFPSKQNVHYPKRRCYVSPIHGPICIK